MNHWFFQNLFYGLKVACFIPSSQRVTATWHGLIAIAAFMFLLQFLFECAYWGAGVEFNYDWYKYHAAMFGLFVLLAFIVCSLEVYFYNSRAGTDCVLCIAVAFYNSYFAIFVAYALLAIISPPWYSHELYNFINQALAVWAFLVMFRLTSEYLALDIANMCLMGALAAGVVYTLNQYVYISQMMYVPEAQGIEENDGWHSMSSEELFAMQNHMRQKDLDKLRASKPDDVDIYALSLGSYARQDVFMKEARFVSDRLTSVLDTKNVITLINNRKTFREVPLANSTNLMAYLWQIRESKMQSQEDIALIYLTSHGDAVQGLSVDVSYRFSQMNLTPERLADILKDSGIKYKVVIIGACFSGVFVPALRDENTMVITASAGDKPAYGCSDDADLTYFAQAYFQYALAKTADLEKAFYIARDMISQRERDEKITVVSEPQIYVGSGIRKALQKYKAAHLISANAPAGKYGPPEQWAMTP